MPKCGPASNVAGVEIERLHADIGEYSVDGDLVWLAGFDRIVRRDALRFTSIGQPRVTQRQLGPLIPLVLHHRLWAAMQTRPFLKRQHGP
jgi:hypothetical protein